MASSVYARTTSVLVIVASVVAAMAQSSAPLDDGTRKFQCPYPKQRVNPVGSGQLPGMFDNAKQPDDFVPFAPRDTVDAATWDTNAFCEDQEGEPEVIQGRVLIKNDDGTCSTCGDAKCITWIPAPHGSYTPDCTGGLKLRSDGLFKMSLTHPGDEKSKGWGPDPYPHVHFSCTGCGGKYWNKYYFEIPDDFCTANGSPSMLVSAPDESNLVVRADTASGVHDYNAFYIIMEPEWTFPMPIDPCWAPAGGNPCPNAPPCVKGRRMQNAVNDYLDVLEAEHGVAA